ncbi:hypothetical protein GBA52_023893 [Prunus armeniaca]|nr:hypothetical protein GBA52_023893 [Prunus armeniaca]
MAEIPQFMLTRLSDLKIEPQQIVHNVAEITFSQNDMTTDNLHLQQQLGDNLCGIPTNKTRKVFFMGPNSLQTGEMYLMSVGNHGHVLTRGWNQIVSQEMFMAGEIVHMSAFRDRFDILWILMHYKANSEWGRKHGFRAFGFGLVRKEEEEEEGLALIMVERS